MTKAQTWLAAAALALLMSATWGNDEAQQATADDLNDAIQQAKEQP